MSKKEEKWPICQACKGLVETPVFGGDHFPNCIFCSWDCVEEYANRGRCLFNLCKQPLRNKKYAIEFCSQGCLDRAKKLLDWAEIAEGMLRD